VAFGPLLWLNKSTESRRPDALQRQLHRANDGLPTRGISEFQRKNCNDGLTDSNCYLADLVDAIRIIVQPGWNFTGALTPNTVWRETTYDVSLTTSNIIYSASSEWGSLGNGQMAFWRMIKMAHRAKKLGTTVVRPTRDYFATALRMQPRSRLSCRRLPARN